MNTQETQMLKSALVAMAFFYGHNLQPDVLKMYVEDLSDLPLEAVLGSLKIMRRDPKITRCPLPAAIRSFINPPKMEARLEAADLSRKMIAAIRDFGCHWSSMTLCAGNEGYWTRSGKLVDTFQEAVVGELGELAWEVIRRRGGWNHFHDEFFASEPTQFHAQLREGIEATIAIAKQGLLDHKPTLPFSNQKLISDEDKHAKMLALKSKMALVGRKA